MDANNQSVWPLSIIAVLLLTIASSSAVAGNASDRLDVRYWNASGIPIKGLSAAYRRRGTWSPRR